MLTTFCLRLACGMIGALLLLPSGEVNPRFYRTQYLVVLGLLSIGALAADWRGGVTFWCLFAIAAFLACLGSIVWSLEGNPACRVIGIANAVWLVATVIVTSSQRPVCGEGQSFGTSHWSLAASNSWSALAAVLLGELTSAALLGTAVTAMLLGHSYLIAPGMSLAPLMRVLAALFAAIGLQTVLAGWGFWSWTAHHSLVNWEDETVLWLPVRWGLGLAGPLVLGWMARSAAKIRSTQSATGILYVVVIFSFLGELTSQLLWANTGYRL